MTLILVTRPGGAAPRWRTLGTVIEAPVLRIDPVAWTPPIGLPEAVILTSANAVRCAGSGAEPVHHLPAFAVGAATAKAARASGWRDVRDGGGTVTAVYATVAAAGFARVLHLAGADRTAAMPPAGVAIDVRVVYAAVAVALPVAVVGLLADGAVDLAPLYSPRSAAEFARQLDAAGVARATVAIAAISAAAAAAAGTGWRRVAVAASPDDDALFAAATALCENAA